MALRNEDKAWISAEIEKATAASRPHGWRKTLFLLRELGPIATIIAIVVALLGITAASIYQSVSHVEKETQFRTQTTDNLTRIGERLTSIEGTLTVLQAQIATQKYSAVPRKELKGHRDELKGIKDKLVQVPPTAPGYWPTAFQIISLLSETTDIEPEKLAKLPEGIMDNVGSNPPGGFAPVKNGRVVLKNLIQGITFENSIVRFEPNVRLVNVVFINCIFVFPPVGENPAKPLQEIGKALLASDLTHVTLNVS